MTTHHYLRRRTPQERRAYLEQHRDEAIAKGISADLIDMMIEDSSYTSAKVETIEDAVRQELVNLWTDLEAAIEYAHNGIWSMQCDDLVGRIDALTHFVGPTPQENAPNRLVLDGTYEHVQALIGYQVTVDREKALELQGYIQRKV